jgi:hypothetical protein
MLRTLGIAGALHAFGVPCDMSAQSRGQPAAATQGTSPTACSILDVAELKRITGRTDILRRGPVPSDPSETPQGVSECEFLGFSFSLASPATKQWFDATRADQVKQGTRVQPVSGLGDDAYYWWDPRPGVHRQVGIAFRTATSRLVIMDLVPADSVEAVKPVLLTVAKAVAGRMR